jgi:hypothetical protein
MYKQLGIPPQHGSRGAILVTDLETLEQFLDAPRRLTVDERGEKTDDFVTPNSDWTTIHSRSYVFYSREPTELEFPEPTAQYSTIMLTSIYKWDSPAQVSDFLHHHPEAGAILETAYSAILAPFGCVEDLTLQVVADPSEPDHSELFVLIRTGDNPGTAREKLKRFENEWLYKQPPHTRQLIRFDVT